jgi:hypothetical protein
MATAAAGLGDAVGKPREIMERTKLLAQASDPPPDTLSIVGLRFFVNHIVFVKVQARLMALTKAHAANMRDNDLKGALLVRDRDDDDQFR